MRTAWAIPGMLSPWSEETGDIKAPVATNSTFLKKPLRNLLRIYEHSTLALHPQPEPPEWTSCAFLSKIKRPPL